MDIQHEVEQGKEEQRRNNERRSDNQPDSLSVAVSYATPHLAIGNRRDARSEEDRVEEVHGPIVA